MPDVDKLSALAFEVGLDFTGPIGHAKLVDLARGWLPDIKFHEDERFHTIDLEEFYSVPAAVFAGLDLAERQQFSIEVGGVPAAPPIVTTGGTLRGEGATAQDALLRADVDANAVYSHGGNLRAAEKFFGSEETADPAQAPRPGNPRLPRLPLRVRAEFRMLLETLKQDLALAELAERRQDVDEPPIDAIWGDFDVTDLLLRRVSLVGSDGEPASRTVRHDFARRLIREEENGNSSAVEALLQNPPLDAGVHTQVNRTVWTALKACGLLEYHFIYAYNDFRRYGGFFLTGGFLTNEHEGDPDEGCCLVFEREKLKRLQNENGDPLAATPMALITSVHNTSNRDDKMRAIAPNKDEAREKLEVFVARGSHATYLDADTHDFLDLADLARESDLVVPALLAIALVFPPLLPVALTFEHFNPRPDETSDQGVTGQSRPVNPSDVDTHRQVEVRVTPLSRVGSDTSIYDLRGGREPLALRAFRGIYGAHTGIRDKSPRWENRTRRYFEHLVRGLETGQLRPPEERPILQ